MQIPVYSFRTTPYLFHGKFNTIKRTCMSVNKLDNKVDIFHDSVTVLKRATFNLLFVAVAVLSYLYRLLFSLSYLLSYLFIFFLSASYYVFLVFNVCQTFPLFYKEIIDAQPSFPFILFRRIATKRIIRNPIKRKISRIISL